MIHQIQMGQICDWMDVTEWVDGENTRERSGGRTSRQRHPEKWTRRLKRKKNMKVPSICRELQPSNLGIKGESGGDAAINTHESKCYLIFTDRGNSHAIISPT